LSLDAAETEPLLAAPGALRPTTYLIAATGITLVANLGVHVILARTTGAGTYGAAGTLLAWSMLASTVASGVQYTVTRTTSISDAGTVELLRRGFWTALPWLCLATAFLAVTPLARGYLHLHSAWAVAAAVGVWLATLAFAVPQGILVGRRNFAAVAIVNVASVGCRYLFLGLMGWKSPDGITAITSLMFSLLAMVGLAIAAAAVLPRRGPAAPRSEAPSGRGLASEGATGAVLATGLWIAWMLPLVFARHFLPAARSGDFTVVQLLVGAILYTTTPIVTVFYPTIARHRRRRDIERAFTAIAGLCVALVLVESALGPTLVHRLYGNRYDASAALFLAMGVSVTATAAAMYGVWVCHALRESLDALIVGVLVAVVIESVVGYGWHSSAIALAIGPTVAMVIGTLTALLLALRRSPRSVVAPAPEACSPLDAASPNRAFQHAQP
jgi:O-antigen/teichoic acid export membrane protein